MQDTRTYAHMSDSKSVLKVHKLCSCASLARFFFIDDNVFSLMSGSMQFAYPLYIAVMTTRTSTACKIQYQFYVRLASHISTPMLISINERAFILDS
jgi:hypothetical protein